MFFPGCVWELFAAEGVFAVSKEDRESVYPLLHGVQESRLLQIIRRRSVRGRERGEGGGGRGGRREREW